MIIRITVRAPGMLIFALIAAFSVNHKLSLVFVAVLPVLGLGMIVIIKKDKPLKNKIYKT